MNNHESNIWQNEIWVLKYRGWEGDLLFTTFSKFCLC